ncbi:MAG: hypothetical protein J6T44_04830 [Prevotella sp.]|nr:hypothetical protein [Prevotella sp.]
MKKYLMTGIAALAMCFGFTSCSHEIEPVSQEDLNQLEAQKIVNNYNQAFLKYVGGNIAANQTWGFGGYSATRTRAIDANGNMWEDCPSVGATERNDVFTYVNTLSARPKQIPSDLSDYYVTHIYQGTDTHGSSNYPNSNMNQLEFAKTSPARISWDGKQEGEWFHIYDFNAAISTDYEGNMLVVNTPPLNFAYYNSSDSKWHDKWIGVPGSEIGEDYKDYYYICFDFEAMPNEIYTIFEMPEANGAKVNVEGRFVGENGANATGADLKAKGITTVTDKFNGQTYTVKDNWKAVQIFNEHYYAPGNDNYTDWIIRLVKAKSEDVDPDNVCIIAEDLSADDATDFDFNDVVFTVEYKTATTAKVTLYAAGGTLPLKVAGTEVHRAFGYGDPDENGLYKMINTGAKANVNGVAPVVLFESLTVDKSKRGNDIEILVDKGKKNDQGVYVPNWIELTATGGEPAAKLCVGTDYATGNKWCAERESIKDKYPEFSKWVANNPTLVWWK